MGGRRNSQGQLLDLDMNPLALVPAPSQEAIDCMPAYIKKKISLEEISFVEQYIRAGGDVELAALRCRLPEDECQRWLSRLYVVDAIQRMVLVMFATDAVVARQVLIEVMMDGATPPGTRRQCANDIIRLAKLDPGHTLNVVHHGDRGPMGRSNFENLSEEEKDTLEKLLAKANNEVDVEIVDVNFSEPDADDLKPGGI